MQVSQTVVGCPPWRSSKPSLPWVVLLEQGLEQMYPEVTSNFKRSNSVVYVDFLGCP